jgi:hypothetical protein
MICHDNKYMKFCLGMSIIIHIFVLLIWLRDHQRVDLVIGGERVDSNLLF